MKLSKSIFFLFIAQACFFSKEEKNPQNKAVHIAISSEPRTLDPRWAVDAQGMRITELLFDPLIRLGPNLKPQPASAKSWSVQGKTYTFYLPKNFTFSNGRKIDKEDILFSVEEFRSPKYPFFSAFKIIDSAVVKEEKDFWRLKLVLKKPSLKFLKSDLPVLKILPKKELLSAGSAFFDQPVSSGPFRLIKKSSRQIVLEKSRSLSEKPPFIDKVVFSIIRDDLTRFQKILKKEVDLVQSDLPPKKIKWFLKEKPEGFKVVESPSLSVSYLLLNFKNSCLKQKKVREAFAFALNPKEIIQYKLYGLAEQARGFLHPSHFFFYEKLKPFVHDLEQAGLLYKNISASCKNHQFSFKTSHLKSVREQAGVLALHLKKAGFKIKIQSHEWGSFYTDLNQGRFDLALLSWTGIVDPDIYRVAFHSQELAPKGRNRGFYINKTLDHLLEQGLKTLKPEERRSFYDTVQTMVREDLVVIPLWHTRHSAVLRDHIKGYRLSPLADFSFLHSIKKEPF